MKNAHPILLVDDEEEILSNYSLILRYAGLGPVVTVPDSRNVMTRLDTENVSVIVLDLIMPHVSGNEMLREIRKNYPQIPVIVMTAMNEVETAVDCMKKGAFDFLIKPVEKERFVSSCRNALEVRGLRNEVDHLRKHLLSDEIEHKDAFASIITISPRMKSIFRYVEAISKTSALVCIVGETGVGKEMLARTLYDLSGLKGGFVAVNVAGLDDAMFSDTLFGHKRGAFSGADQDREGLVAQADGGMLLLDEIGDLSETSQVKLLRLLEESQYYPLGADVPRKSGAKIIACTNRDLDQLMKEGKFRRDLYYRICGHLIHIPPLRERPEDIPVLFDHFLKHISSSLSLKAPEYAKTVPLLLMNHDFPGNVRELQTIVNDLIVRSDGGRISDDLLKSYIRSDMTEICASGMTSAEGSIQIGIYGRFPTLRDIEDYIISEAMKRANGRQQMAAAMLGISRQALNRRLLNKSRQKNR